MNRAELGELTFKPTEQLRKRAGSAVATGTVNAEGNGESGWPIDRDDLRIYCIRSRWLVAEQLA